MFTGFTVETQQFMEGLLFHNEKPWFEAHKEEFEKHLRLPFRELALDTQEKMAERFPKFANDLHIARIYRDARRLFGRGPYKEHLWFSLETPGGKETGPALWFEVGAEGFGLGNGIWGAPSVMAQWRKAIDADPAGFLRMAEKTVRGGPFAFYGERYSRPKGHEGVPLDTWYNRKAIGLEMRGDFEGILLSPDLPDFICDSFSVLLPLTEFMRKVTVGVE